MMGVSPTQYDSILIRRGNVDPVADRRKKTWRNRAKMAVYKSKEGQGVEQVVPSEGNNSADTLIVDFSPPEVWEGKVLQFKPHTPETLQYSSPDKLTQRAGSQLIQSQSSLRNAFRLGFNQLMLHANDLASPFLTYYFKTLSYNFISKHPFYQKWKDILLGLFNLFI